MKRTSKYCANIFFLIFLFIMITGKDFYACDKCFGAQVDTPVTRGISMAMLALLIMIGGVGSCVTLFFIRMSRRARLIATGNYYLTKQGEFLRIPLNKNRNVLDDDPKKRLQNELLDKINHGGMGKLTARELKVLREVTD